MRWSISERRGSRACISRARRSSTSARERSRRGRRAAFPTGRLRIHPSTLVFGNNATINKVKDGLNGQGYGHSGSTMYGFVTAGTGACCVWDADDGRKTGICTGTHYRVYADSDDRMYTPSWGYFVMGTTHRDNDECPGGAGPTHGWSEEAESNVRGASNNAGWAIYPDYLPFNNSVVTSWIGNRYYQNNGLATLITMP